MRHLFAWGLLAALALPARADIVDGGNLQIGGQGLFGGTVTVQGNALGVAGSVSATSATLSATGAQTYALTTSSGIHMTNGKLKLDSGGMIEWPDGTKSTTAAGGGGGDAVLNATQTFSGANTFTATTTIGSATGGLTIPQGTTCTGIACRVAYSSGTYNSFSFVIQEAKTYHLEYTFSLASGTSSQYSTFRCFINGDTTSSNYLQYQVGYPVAYNINSNSYGMWGLDNCGTGAVNASDYTSGFFKINTAPGVSNRLTAIGAWTNTCQTQSYVQTAQSSMQYKGTGPWTLTCNPYVGAGWNHEAILYQVGK